MLAWVLHLIADVLLGGLLEAVRSPLGAGTCPRCRRRTASTPAPGGPTHILVCIPCVRLINRNLRAGAGFFLSLGVLMGLMWVLGMWATLSRGGPVDRGFAIAVPLVGGVLALVGAAIRRAVKDPPETSAASSQATIEDLGAGRPIMR